MARKINWTSSEAKTIVHRTSAIAVFRERTERNMASTGSEAAAEVAAAQVLEKTTTDPRFTRGQTLLKEKRLEEAVVVFEDLLRTMYVLLYVCVDLDTLHWICGY